MAYCLSSISHKRDVCRVNTKYPFLKKIVILPPDLKQRWSRRIKGQKQEAGRPLLFFLSLFW